jgi:hypothetical protein
MIFVTSFSDKILTNFVPSLFLKPGTTILFPFINPSNPALAIPKRIGIAMQLPQADNGLKFGLIALIIK